MTNTLAEPVVKLRGEYDFYKGTDADQDNWIDLAKKYKIRLPLWRLPCTSGGMRRFLKKLNISVEDYLSRNEEKNLREFNKRNPTWPLRAWVGLQLEWIEWDQVGYPELIAEEQKEPPVKRGPGRPRKVVEESA